MPVLLIAAIQILKLLIAGQGFSYCAQPTLRRFGQETTVRPSLALYNNYEDIDRMIAALRRLKG